MRKFLIWLFFLSLLKADISIPCGVFSSAINAKGNVARVKVCGSDNVRASSIDLFSRCSVDKSCSNLSKCKLYSYDKTIDIDFIESKKTTNFMCSNKSDGCVLDKNNYKDYDDASRIISNSVLHFKASDVCPYDTTKKCMYLGNVTLQKKVYTLEFEPGDYYFDSLNILTLGSKIILPNGGPVRIFINNEFKVEGDINSNGNSKDLFLYVNGNIIFNNSAVIKGYIYSTYGGDININGGYRVSIYGAITVNGNLNGNSSFRVIYKGEPTELGFYECPLFQNIYSCNIFNTALTSYKGIYPKQNGIYNTCKISVKDYNLIEDKNHPITCYQNGVKCSCNPNIEHCSLNNTCTIVDAPKNKLNYKVYTTPLIQTYIVDRNWDDDLDDEKIEVDKEKNKLKVTFEDELYYGSYILTKDVSEVHFKADVSYDDIDDNDDSDDDRKLMILGDVILKGSSKTLYFDEGDYYFNSFKIDKGNNGDIQISICAKGNVRIFVKNDFVYSGKHLNDDGCGGKIFVYVQGNAVIGASEGGRDTIPIFIYSKGSVTIKNNGNSADLVGAITAEKEINIVGMNSNFYYDKSASDFGYGECPLCFALNNNGSWVVSSSFYNSKIEFYFPRSIAIINNGGYTLKDLNVTQGEINPSWLSLSGACYNVVDQDGNVVSRDIDIQANGMVVGNMFIKNCIFVGSVFSTVEVNTSANFGDYPSGGYKRYYAINTYKIGGTFRGKEINFIHANYFDDEDRFYSIDLDYCNIPQNLLTPVVNGNFDAWDANESKNITTKIANEEFNLTIAFLGDSTSNSIIAKYSLYDEINKDIIYEWRNFDISKKEENVSFNVSKAYKDVRVIFRACADYNGSDYKIYPYNSCVETCENSKEINKKCYRYFKSSDDFAIRPYAFLVFGNNQYKRAGEEFYLTIKAIDKDNNLTSGNIDSVKSVLNYNEKLSNLNFEANFYVPTAYELSKMIADVGDSNVTYCPDKGVFSLLNDNDRFVDGEANVTLKYSETGILTLKVSEKAGSEFAKVDADDTPDSQRLIAPTNVILDREDLSKKDLLLFIPYKFVTIGDYNTTTNQNWIYVSNDVNKSFYSNKTPKMASVVEFVITAYNKDNQKVLNYTRTCFPDISVDAPKVNGLKLNTTFDLFLDIYLDANASDTLFVYAEGNLTKSPMWLPSNKVNISKGLNHVRASISQMEFKNGSGSAKVYLNVKKVYNKPKNPILLEVKDINTSTSWMYNSDATNIFIPMSINKAIEYRYGAIFVENKSVYGNEANLTVRYMYFNDNWLLNTEHNSSMFGDINITKLNELDNNLSYKISVSNTPINKGEEKLIVTTTHALPYSVKLHLPIDSWLWYYPLAKSYQPPSVNNLDCLTHPCVKVNFLKSSKGWAGVGRKSKYNEKNVTIKANISEEVNVSKEGVKKLNW